MMEHTGPDTGLMDHIGLTCPNCHPVVTFNPSLRQRIVEHIGAHILYDPSADCSSEPCGLCLRPTPLCKIVLKKAKGHAGKIAIDMKASSCPNLVKFSITVAAECSDSSPCTNRPIVCPHCDDSESSRVVWSYNFRFHLLHKHPRISLEDHRDMLTLTKLERDGMKRIWKNRLKQQTLRRKSQRAPLVISETHRSRLVLEYVFLSYSYLSTTQLMHKFHSSEPEMDTSDEGSSSDSCSGHDEEVAESSDEEDTTPVVVGTANVGTEVQDLDYGSE